MPHFAAGPLWCANGNADCGPHKFAIFKDRTHGPAETCVSHILASNPRYAISMTVHSKIWAIVTLAFFLPLGAIIMAGYIPGAGSDLKAVKGFAISTSNLVEEHGALFTGFFYMVVGCFISAVFLVWGDDLRRSDGGDGSGAVGDCGDGGD